MMNLKTERLLIRNFKLSDAQNIFELDTDPDVMKFMDGPMKITIEDSIATLERQFIYYEKHPGLGVFECEINDTNEFIGWGALKFLDKSDKIEVGYRLMKRAWGKGYATEITKALLTHGFEIVKLKEIHAVTHPENIASQNVLKKSGLKYIGMDKYYDKDVKVFRIDEGIYVRVGVNY